MFRRLSFGSVRGIPISASGSWLLVVFVLVWLGAEHLQRITAVSPTSAVLLGAFAVALFFGSVVAHELGHAFAAQRAGIKVRGIELWMFGGVAHLSEHPRTPREEFRIAVAGPLVTLMIAVLLLGGAWLVDQSGVSAAIRGDQTGPLLAILVLIGALNGAMLILNLLPAYPLDGGVLLHALAWSFTGDRHRATRAAATGGQVIGYLLIFGGILLTFNGRQGAAADGFTLALLGLLITIAARASLISSNAQERLDKVTVGAIADPSVSAVDGHHTVLDATDHGGAPGAWVVVRGEAGARPALLAATAIDDALAKGQPTLTLMELAQESEDRTIDGDVPLREAMTDRRLLQGGAVLALSESGAPLGIVTSHRLAEAVARSARGR